MEVSIAALEQIRTLALGSRGKETGGILVGFNIGRDIRVIEASDSGPNAQRSSTHFLRDTRYCQAFLAERFQQFGADYVGEWHSHVVDLHRLSYGDLLTLAGIFIDPDYDFETFAVVLVVIHRNSAELLVYLADRQPSRQNRVAITQLHRGEFPNRTVPNG